MVTHVLIDGYNLLGARGQVGPDTAAARERLLRELSLYQQRKGLDITVVFDGWRQGFGAEQHEHRTGVHVIYSKRGERADQVLQRLAAELGARCAVVSSDHEVAHSAQVSGALVLSAAEFERRLNEPRPVSPSPGAAEKDRDEPARPRSTAEKKGNPKKLPKALRQRNRRLKRF